jgi:hypothetical protein
MVGPAASATIEEMSQAAFTSSILDGELARTASREPLAPVRIPRSWDRGWQHPDIDGPSAYRRIVFDLTASLLDTVAREEHLRLDHRLSIPRVSRRRLGLPHGVQACVFDLEGALAGSARLHAAAWAVRRSRPPRPASVRKSRPSSASSSPSTDRVPRTRPAHGADLVVTDLTALLDRRMRA